MAGLSGWMYILFGISGSALPATIHLLKVETDLFQICLTPLKRLTSSPTLSMAGSVCLLNEGSVVGGLDKIWRQGKVGGDS